MKSLYDYIKDNKTIDAHVHLFNHIEFIPSQDEYDMCVGFGDIEFDTDMPLSTMYNKFMKELPDNVIPLCTGRNIEEITKIYNKYPKKFKGFGEIKLYSKYQDNDVNFKKISFLRDVCRLSKENGNKPIYFHWNVESNKDIIKIVKVIKDFPSIPFIWCHCGMWEGGDLDFIFSQIRQVAMENSNLWLDISYDALKYFINGHIFKITQLPLDRVVIGSDLNMKSFGPNHSQKEITEIYNNMKSLRQFVNSDLNVKKLFGV